MPQKPTTPEQRRAVKQAKRAANQANHVRVRALATSGHQRVVVACNAVLAASKRLGVEDQNRLARAVAEVAEAARREYRP